MAYITPIQYYINDGNVPSDLNWGSYQYVTLADIVNNFMMIHVGNHSLLNHVPRHKVIFHAKRAVQEMNYDAFKEVRAKVIPVDELVAVPLPSDYVNWIRVSIYKNGQLLPLQENMAAMSATQYLRDNANQLLFDQDGYVLSAGHSIVDTDRMDGKYTGHGGLYAAFDSYEHDNQRFFPLGVGRKFGLETSMATGRPLYRIDARGGVINFDSRMTGELCVLEYVSDGLENGRDDLVAVNKLFELFIYSYIKTELLTDKVGVQEYVVNRAKKERTAARRNAMIRAKDFHPSRLLMALRGMDKIIK